MATLEQSQTLLTESRAYLKACKQEVYNLLKSPEVALWKDISLKKDSILIQMLNVKAIDVEEALKSYPALAKKISNHIATCDNEVGNQLADLMSKPAPDKALLDAQNLEAKCQQLESIRQDLKKHTDFLASSLQTLKNSLTIQHLIPIARRMAHGKSGLFDSGMEIYLLLTEDDLQQNNQKTLIDLSQQADQLSTRFKHTEIPKLPRLAEEIFAHYLEIGNSTNTEVVTFINTTKNRVEGELASIRVIKDDLHELQKKELPDILTDISRHAKNLKDIISGFHHRKQLKKNLSAVTETLEYLNIYHLAIKNKIGSNLEQKAIEINSPLNPATIASRMTRAFFIGAKGLIRSVKMMVKSLTGDEGINEVELQLILETSINRCKNFYGTSTKDVKRMQVFINELIVKYPKPFPYNDLFKLIKSVVASYGAEVTRYIQNYGIKNEFQPLTQETLPSNMGQLTKKITERKAIFKKANSG